MSLLKLNCDKFFVALILMGIILGGGPSLKASPLNDCVSALAIVKNWPPQDWNVYFKSSVPASRSFRKVNPKPIEAPEDDYRIYLVPNFIMPSRQIEPFFQNKTLSETSNASIQYRHSYREHYSGDEWAIFRSEDGTDFNLNVSLFDPKSKEFLVEMRRIYDLVKLKKTNSLYDDFFRDAVYLYGSWNRRPLYLMYQNEYWPESHGSRIEYFPVGPALGDGNDHLMVSRELIYYPQDQLIVENYRRFRSVESKEENLYRGRAYLKVDSQDESAILKAGRDRYLDFLADIHQTLLPDYSERRRWSKEFIDQLIEDSLTMQDQIEFSVVREIKPDGLFGEVIGVIGFNTSAYGQVQHLDKSSGQWTRRTGLTGTAVARYHADLIPWGESNYDGSLWSAPILELPVDHYVKNPESVSRPSLLERIERQSTRHSNVGRAPIFFSSGERLEVTRFWVTKKGVQRKTILAKLLYAWIHRINAIGTSPEYAAKAIAQMTYNPEKEGRRLYSPFGYSSAPEIELDQTALKKATAFLSDTQNFLQALSDPGFLRAHLSENELQTFLQFLDDNRSAIFSTAIR